MYIIRCSILFCMSGFTAGVSWSLSKFISNLSLIWMYMYILQMSDVGQCTQTVYKLGTASGIRVNPLLAFNFQFQAMFMHIWRKKGWQSSLDNQYFYILSFHDRKVPLITLNKKHVPQAIYISLHISVIGCFDSIVQKWNKLLLCRNSCYMFLRYLCKRILRYNPEGSILSRFIKWDLFC